MAWLLQRSDVASEDAPASATDAGDQQYSSAEGADNYGESLLTEGRQCFAAGPPASDNCCCHPHLLPGQPQPATVMLVQLTQHTTAAKHVLFKT